MVIKRNLKSMNVFNINEVNRNDKTLLEVYQKGCKLQCFFYRQKISIPTIRADGKYPFLLLPSIHAKCCINQSWYGWYK